MTSGIVFILHGPADAPYAAELAEALSPHLAFPVALGADGQKRATQYGAGAVCVVLWTQDASARALAGVVAEAMPDTVSSAVICRIGDAPLPASFAANTRVQAHATARDTAAPLLEAIARRQLDLAERGARPRGAVAPSFGSAAYRPAVRETGKHRLAVRSAWGFAATMAVAGVAAPLIGGRAGAANITPDQAVPPPEAVAVSAAAEVTPELDAAGEVVLAAYTPVLQPPRDTLEALIEPPLAIPLTHEPAALPLDAPLAAEIAFDASQLDPKTSEVIAGMIAGAAVSAWKIEAVAPAPAAQHEKPSAAGEAAKPGV